MGLSVDFCLHNLVFSRHKSEGIDNEVSKMKGEVSLFFFIMEINSGGKDSLREVDTPRRVEKMNFLLLKTKKK